MGQIERKKRRGRPSNIDRARRNSQLAPPSSPDRRSTRRRRNVRYNFDIDDYVDDDEFYNARREKKLRLLLFDDDLPRRGSHAPAPMPSSSSSDEASSSDEDEEYGRKRTKKKRKLDRRDESDDEIDEIRRRTLDEEEEENEEEDEEEEAGGSDFDCGTASDHPKRVPMPDKKTLELILDKLQKKDIYGVYAEPVDPEELPDYHDVITHPMDFATVRKKLAKGLYLSLKEFESDVYLICSNAMQYNAPDTVYYKQASSIQELAKLKFQRLRANTDLSEKEFKSDHKTTPSFSMPKKQLKKPVARTTPDPDPDPDLDLDQVGTETFSDATVRTGEFQDGSPAQTPARQVSDEVLITENSSLGDNNDKDQELLPEKGCISKLGKKPSLLDENRRATYNVSLEPVTESDSVLSTFVGESKQFIPVGLHVDHSYARSLARFAATLGPVAWKIASNTIEQALPEGVKFGPGWVGEYEPLPTPVLVPENRTLKEPSFLAHFKIPSVVKNHQKASKSPKVHMDVKEVSDCFNPAVLVKQESPRLPHKEPSPSPSPRLSPSPSPSPSPRTSFFPGSNLMHQNPHSRNFTRPENMGLSRVEQARVEQARIEQARVEQARIEQARVEQSRVEQVEQSRIKQARVEQARIEQARVEQAEQSRIKQARVEQARIEQARFEQSRVEQARVEQARFEQSRVEQARVEQARVEQSRVEQTRVEQARVEQARVELNHPPPLHVTSAADFVSKRPVSNASDIPSKPVSRNGNLASLGSFKHQGSNNDRFAPGVPSQPVGHDFNRTVPMDNNNNNNNMAFKRDLQGLSKDSFKHPGSNNDRFAPGTPSQPVGLDFNRFAPMDNINNNNNNMGHMAPRRDLQGLSDPVQMMKMLSQESQQQYNNNNNNGFGFGSKRDDSNNVALTAAQAWMSLGGAATKPPLVENRNPVKQQISADSLYNPTRFRGEFNTFQQPVRPVNEGQLPKHVGFPQMVTAADLSRFQVQSGGWRGVPPQMQQQPRPRQESRPPDLNIGYQSIGSPVRQSTGMLVDSQQPDLALQL